MQYHTILYSSFINRLCRWRPKGDPQSNALWMDTKKALPQSSDVWQSRQDWLRGLSASDLRRRKQRTTTSHSRSSSSPSRKRRHCLTSLPYRGGHRPSSFSPSLSLSPFLRYMWLTHVNQTCRAQISRCIFTVLRIVHKTQATDQSEL